MGRRPKEAPVTSHQAEDDFSSIAKEALAAEAKEREQIVVSNVTYVSIVGRMSQATMKTKAGYVPGAKLGDVVTSSKLNLGASPEVTVLGIFKLYGQFEPDHQDEKGKNVLGALKRYIMPEDAAQIRGLAKDRGLFVDNFNVALPNGHIVRPMHWVYLYLHEAPEITNAVFSLRSTNNVVAYELSKIIQGSVTHSAELRFKLGYRIGSNDKGEWYAPEFVCLDQRNFKIQDDEIQTVRGGLSKQEIMDMLKLSTEQRKAYNDSVLVTGVDVKALFGTQNPRRALPAGKVTYEEDDDEAVNF